METVIYRLGPYDIPRIGKQRPVRVYLTNEGSSRPAPLLVMFDGQNVFHDRPSFSGGWHLHHIVEHLRAEGLPAPVVVGIDHGGPRRIDELSPYPCVQTRGKFPALLEWMSEELVPSIRKQFAVMSSPEATFVGGSSMGGLASLYAHLARPDVFGGAMVMSPAFWVAGPKIFDFARTVEAPEVSRIYMDAGAREDGMRMLRGARKMEKILRERGYDEQRLKFVADPAGFHNEADWRRRAPDALRWLIEPIRAALPLGTQRRRAG